MSSQESDNEESGRIGLPESPSSPGLIRSILGLARREPRDGKFQAFVRALEQHELGRESALDHEIEQNYRTWALNFELLKTEFNAVWELFSGLERELSGWYCVSPSLARWQAVGCSKGGYTFSACIMKNSSRNAPLSEKSLAVSFALDELPAGIGDERLFGRPEPLDDTLIGLESCTGKTKRDLVSALRFMNDRMNHFSLVFRLNHRAIGQQAQRLPLEILKERSLVDLCQGLFVLLNDDVVKELSTRISSPEQLLLSHP